MVQAPPTRRGSRPGAPELNAQPWIPSDGITVAVSPAASRRYREFERASLTRMQVAPRKFFFVLTVFRSGRSFFAESKWEGTIDGRNRVSNSFQL